MIKKFRKKPVVIEAIIWDGTNATEVISFCEGQASFDDKANVMVIETLESNVEARTRHAATVSDYVIKGVNGEFYFCKKEIFEKTYDDVIPDYVLDAKSYISMRESDMGFMGSPEYYEKKKTVDNYYSKK